ncbi:MAG: PAS domain S-box protein [Dehalococcoidia bacterium]|nr:MAG: PAS domain S-box protein [Dehalococcoidia bacterium]
MTARENASSTMPAENSSGEGAELLRQKLQQAEEALRGARAELECVLDLVTHGIRIVNKDYSIKAINRALAEMSGVSAEQVVGRKCYEIFPSVACHTGECRMARILGGEESVRVEIERARSDGSTVPCLVTAIPFHGPEGETAGIIETFRDITMRRQMQAQLLESEERYKALINLGTEVGEAVVMLQDESGIEALQTFVSDEWPRITGYDKNELLSMSFFDLVIPAERVASMERHRIKMSGKTLPGLFEINIVRRDGAIIPVELTSAFTMYRGQRANVAYIRDISERKKAEKELKKQTIIFQAHLDSSLDGIMVVDPEGNRLIQNSSVDRIWGIPQRAKNQPGAGPGLPVVSARTKDSQQFHDKVLRLANDPTEKIRDEVELINGKVIERYSAPITGADGKRYGRIWNFHDVTETKKAERALRESEELYRTLFENTGTATSLAEEDATIVLVNTEFEKLSGYSKAEIEGKKKWTEFIPAADLPLALEYSREISSDPSRIPNGFELRFVARNKRIKNVIVTVNRIPGGTRRIASIKDITRRKRVEKDLKKSRQRIRGLLEHVELVREEERKRIAVEIHDELGQLLTALKMDVVWLAKRIPAEQENMQKRASSMRQTVDMTIQSVKRISAELRPHVLDNLGLSAAIEWQVKQIKDVTGVDCRFVSSPPDVTPDADTAVALFRIFQEAITNAVRHSKASQIMVELRQFPVRIRLTVEDNGLGIKHSEINDAKAFGLIGIKEKARALGGDVEITGRPNRGTVITAEIPLRKKEDINGKDTYRG